MDRSQSYEYPINNVCRDYVAIGTADFNKLKSSFSMAFNEIAYPIRKDQFHLQTACGEDRTAIKSGRDYIVLILTLTNMQSFFPQKTTSNLAEYKPFTITP